MTEHIFVFNLRAFDRINVTPDLVEQEKKSGVKYQDIQRGIAESIMTESVHPNVGKEGDLLEKNYDNGDWEKEQQVDQLRKFEEQRRERSGDEVTSKDSVAQTSMLDGGKLSDEPWEGDPESEKDHFIQEELYVHAKVCIVDDRVVICGSANINDRVSPSFLPRSLACTWPRSRS